MNQAMNHDMERAADSDVPPLASENIEEVSPFLQLIIRFLTMGAILVGTTVTTYTLFH